MEQLYSWDSIKCGCFLPQDFLHYLYERKAFRVQEHIVTDLGDQAHWLIERHVVRL